MGLWSFMIVGILLAAHGDAYLVSLKKYAAGITRVHNFYRQRENAADMQMLEISDPNIIYGKPEYTPVWDKRLSQRAAEWSENCYWGHQKRGLGENLAYQWSTGSLKPSEVIIKAIKGWYEEKYIWRWSTQCGAACHYTQMVWAKTSMVGCAYSICSSLSTSGQAIRNAHFLVCFYNPPGNYYGQYPFWYGAKCSKCGDKERCQDGLCCSDTQNTHSRYLPLGKRLEEELEDSVKPQYSFAKYTPLPDASKLKISIEVTYDGQMKQLPQITSKYENILKNEIMQNQGHLLGNS